MLRTFLPLAVATASCAQTPVNPEPELGQVHWLRDLDAAMAQAKRDQRPVFLLFQEIPGCDTCTGFGRDVLGDPLLTAAIETTFVPIVVRNNVGGTEKTILDRYGEPAWNNPVVRFLDAQGADLIPRRDGIWTTHGIAVRMCEALRAAKAPVPGYLQLARDANDPATATAVFRMHCFWEGEAVLGALSGVVATRAAFLGDAEVVEVTYLPAQLALAQLTAQVAAKSCQPVDASGATTALRAAPAADQKHALGGTPYATLGLTPMQQMKVHAALTLGTDPRVWLTPAQLGTVAASEAKQRGAVKQK